MVALTDGMDASKSNQSNSQNERSHYLLFRPFGLFSAETHPRIEGYAELSISSIKLSYRLAKTLYDVRVSYYQRDPFPMGVDSAKTDLDLLPKGRIVFGSNPLA